MTEFKSFFKRVAGNEGILFHYNTRLDTYGKGCSHNCAYCYARSLLDFRKMWTPESPAVADFRKIEQKVRKELRKGDVVRLGGMTDCLMPIERKEGVTRRTIELLNDCGVHYLIVTKSDLIGDYAPILDKDLAHIQVSITSTDNTISRKVEPGAPSPYRRIAAVEKLYFGGFDVSVRLSPFIPQFVDLSIINSIQCDKILVEFLRVNGWIRKWLGELVDFSPYYIKSGGYNHLPLKAKVELMKQIDFKQKSVCEDVPAHWHFWRYYFNANPDDCCNLRK